MAQDQRIKILGPSLLAAAMLFAAVARWPYGYYQLLRWVVCGAGIYTSVIIYQSKASLRWATWLLVALAILFNPLVPFDLARETWRFANLAGGVLFLSVALLSAK
jgi:hypothetical protein